MLSEFQVVAVVETISVHELRGWVRAGWVAPAAGDAGPMYDELDLARIQLLSQLRRDLDVPEEAMPLVLSLLDQVHGLRRELRTLAQAVEAQPDPVRDNIRAVYKTLIQSRDA